MPREDGLPPGTLVLLILRVLASQPLHGYAIAQRIAALSRDELSVEETMQQITDGWNQITDQVGRDAQLQAYQDSLGVQR